MDEIVLSDKQIAALAAFAASEGDYAAAASEPISPPADVTTDKELLHWFFNSYLPEHHQRFRVYDAASKTQKFRGPITTNRGHPSNCDLVEPKPEDANKSAFTDAELQILIDGSLRGDQFLSWKPLVNHNHRQPSNILEQESQLVGKTVPEMWLWTRTEVYRELRDDRTNDGESLLKDVEWKELVIWVDKGYEGLNPAVFHYSRSTERLRQEVRVIEDLADDVIHRLGTIFLAERAQASPPDLKKLVPKKYKPFIRKGKKQSEETRAKQVATKKKNREAQQGGAASASKVVKKKAKTARKVQKVDSTKGKAKTARKVPKVDSTEGTE